MGIIIFPLKGEYPALFEFFPIITLIFSAIAAIAAIISIYYLLTSRPKLKVLLNGEGKELTVRANEEYQSTLRIINLRNVATELSRVIIKFPESFKILSPSPPQVANKLNKYIPKDLNIPSDVMEPGRFIDSPKPIARDSKIIIERRGLLPWNLPGKGYLDFLIHFRTPTDYKNYKLEITVQTTSKTFIKNVGIKVVKGDGN
jgi:hypothetical protein